MNRLELEKRTGLTGTVAPSGIAGMVCLLLFFSTTGRINSQWPAVPEAKSPETMLTEMKASNAELLKKQQATLDRLDVIQKNADQLRIFSSQH